MSDDKNFNVLNLLVVIVKWKRMLAACFLACLILSYLMIYFFIDPAYDAKVTIIPSEENNVTGLTNLLKNMKSLPLDIGGSIQNKEMELYNTIIYSRSMLEEVINKFDLIKIYKLDSSNVDYKEIALKKLKSNIDAKETNDNAYEIKVRANTPNNAAAIANYLVDLLNKKIIDLKVNKSRENRIFLEQRLNDIRITLKKAEDSLRRYQEYSNLFDAKEQIKGIIGAYSALETSLITKQIEESILERILSKDSPQLNEVKIQVSEYKRKIDDIRANGQPNSLLFPFKSLPDKSLKYLRLYRDVEINSTLLEFILPLYEQSKFDEQKDIPVVQIIDYAIPPAKKSYPPRVIFTLIITMGFLFMVLLYILIKENKTFANTEQIEYIKRNLFKWS